MGKGDKPRPLSVPKEQFDNNWDKIFNKPKDPGGKILCPLDMTQVEWKKNKWVCKYNHEYNVNRDPHIRNVNCQCNNGHIFTKKEINNE